MLLTKQHPHLHKEITDASAFVLFQLSASNYDTLIGSVNQIFASAASSSEEDTIAQLGLIEHLNLKRERLMDLLGKVNRAAPAIKKAGVQLALARVLRKAIWNWIDHYPMEFVTLCKSGVKLSGMNGGGASGVLKLVANLNFLSLSLSLCVCVCVCVCVCHSLLIQLMPIRCLISLIIGLEHRPRNERKSGRFKSCS
jgi:hypothetical protein